MQRHSFHRPHLTGTALKTIAAGAMLLDHIAYFFGFTGRVPGWFGAVGRIAAPLFLFCLAEGFAHTHDKKRYFLRIYLMAALMGGALFFMRYAGFAVRADGFYPENSILTAYALLLPVWQGIDCLRERRVVKGLALVLLPIVWPFAAGPLFAASPASLNTIEGFLCYTFLPIWNATGDTSLPVMVTGVLMYALRGNRRAQAAGFALFTMLYHFVFVGWIVSRLPGFAPVQMLTMYYEWLGVFAAALMLCYNGERGAERKAVFYAFYPGHVYALYALSCALCAALT